MALLRAKLAPGMTRAEAYGRIRSFHRVAVNPFYDRWDKLPNGTFVSETYRTEPNGNTVRIRDDVQQWPIPTYVPPKNRIPRRLWFPWAWPNHAHPWVEVVYDMGSIEPFCSNATHLRVDFDSRDRISEVQEKPVQDCVEP
jgi:hypothetical protein